MCKGNFGLREERQPGAVRPLSSSFGEIGETEDEKRMFAQKEGQRRNLRTSSVYEGRNSRRRDLIHKAQNLAIGVMPVAQKLGHVLR